MVKVVNYAILIIGLSLLLAFAGIQTTTSGLVGKWVGFTPNTDGSFNASTFNASEFRIGGAPTSGGGSDAFSWLFTAFGLGALTSIGIAFATRDLGQTLKSGLAVMTSTLFVGDFKAILTLALSVHEFGGLVGIIGLLIYIPLGLGFIFALVNWIGGTE